MSISAEFHKPDPQPVVHRWMLYENGECVGTTRSATVVRAVRCHDEVVAALEDCYAEMVKNGWDAEKGLRETARAALASARGEVVS